MTCPLSPNQSERVSQMLVEAGLAQEFRAAALVGGANNRVFRIESGGRKALLKIYFQQPDDPRDRLGAEFAFTQFLDRWGISAAPRPWACDREHGMALYEFVEGRKLSQDEIGRSHVRAAFEFVRQINRRRGDPQAQRLPIAAEACFSLSQHAACVRRRIERLEAIEPQAAIDVEARRFVVERLAPQWRSIWERVQRQAPAWGVSAHAEPPPEGRCLSPSDFGFHNALLDERGGLRFFDFEYAGWDDPAKLACDFFCQVQLPAPRWCMEEFVAAWSAEFPRPEDLRRRIDLLFPVYQAKWCCILLNEFLPAAARRRQFSGAEGDWEARQAEQLDKALAMLQEIA